MNSWDEDIIENYDIWDEAIPPLPSRSRLYRLEPIGIGTPYVECLTSYVARLASMHSLSTKDLVVQEIMPLQGHTITNKDSYYHAVSSWNKHAYLLNGTSPNTQQWVVALQTLTTYNNLYPLTMLTWSNVIANSKLLRQGKAWCPLCYEEWRQSGHVIYDPLLWTLKCIDICLRHRRPLTNQCPHCHETLPFLTKTTVVGYCLRCMLWLGCPFQTQISECFLDRDNDYGVKIWVAEVIGELLSATSNLSNFPVKEQIAFILQNYLNRFSEGNISALARLLDVSIQQVWRHLRGNVPYFDSLLHMCYVLSITPLDFLTTNINPSQEAMKTNVTSLLPAMPRNKKKPLTETDVQYMRQALEKVLMEETDRFSNLQKIAQNLDYSVATLRKHCPDLCQAIKIRYRRQFAGEDALLLMKEELEKALVSEKSLSLDEISCQYGCSSSVMRRYFPDYCVAIVKRHQNRFDYEKIQKQLEEFIEKGKDIPSIRVLAQQLGCKKHILLNKFPLLCKKIVALRRISQKRLQEEKIDKMCGQVRSTVLELHQQGIYPSSGRVIKFLDNPYILLNKRANETWKLLLEDLGYRQTNLLENDDKS